MTTADPTPDIGRDLAILAARAADSKQGTDIVVLDVAPVLAICEYFVVCSAGNTRLVAAIAAEIEEQSWLGMDRKVVATEGMTERRWVLLDYGDVVVHIFLDTERDYYRLDRLYGDVPRIDWTESVAPASGSPAVASSVAPAQTALD